MYKDQMNLNHRSLLLASILLLILVAFDVGCTGDHGDVGVCSEEAYEAFCDGEGASSIDDEWACHHEYLYKCEPECRIDHGCTQIVEDEESHYFKWDSELCSDNDNNPGYLNEDGECAEDVDERIVCDNVCKGGSSCYQGKFCRGSEPVSL